MVKVKPSEAEEVVRGYQKSPSLDSWEAGHSPFLYPAWVWLMFHLLKHLKPSQILSMVVWGRRWSPLLLLGCKDLARSGALSKSSPNAGERRNSRSQTHRSGRAGRVQEALAMVGSLLSLWPLLFRQHLSLPLCVFVRQRTQLRLQQRRMQGKGREYLEQE